MDFSVESYVTFDSKSDFGALFDFRIANRIAVVQNIEENVRMIGEKWMTSLDPAFSKDEQVCSMFFAIQPRTSFARSRILKARAGL